MGWRVWEEVVCSLGRAGWGKSGGGGMMMIYDDDDVVQSGGSVF